AAVARGGERLGDGDLDPGEPRPCHPVQRDGMAAVVTHADRLGDADLASPPLGRVQHDLGVLEGEALHGDHGTSTKTPSPSTRTGDDPTLPPRAGKTHWPLRPPRTPPAGGEGPVAAPPVVDPAGERAGEPWPRELPLAEMPAAVRADITAGV